MWLFRIIKDFQKKVVFLGTKLKKTHFYGNLEQRYNRPPAKVGIVKKRINLHLQERQLA